MDDYEDEKLQNHSNLKEFVDSSFKRFKYFFGSSLSSTKEKIEKRLQKIEDSLSNCASLKNLSDQADRETDGRALLFTQANIIESRVERLDSKFHLHCEKLRNDYLSNEKFESIHKEIQLESFRLRMDFLESHQQLKKDFSNSFKSIQEFKETWNEGLNERIEYFNKNHDMVLNSLVLYEQKVKEHVEKCEAEIKKLHHDVFMQQKKIEHIYTQLERAGIYKKDQK